MAVDYISALNAGSGLNTTQIVDAIVDAETLPQEEAINTKVEERTVSLSSMSLIKQGFTTFETALDTIDGDTGLAATSSASSYASMTITDEDLVEELSTNIEISALAQSQTLVFGGYTNTTDAVGSGSILFEFGNWSNNSFTENSAVTEQTVTIAQGEDSLEEVRDSINAADIGVTASILQVGTGSYSLVVKATSGADYALRMSTTETVGDAGLDDLDFSTYDANHVAQVGQDAAFTLDGVPISRTSNTITDLYDGVTVELEAVTTAPVQLEVNYDSTAALATMTDLVAQLNTINSLLTTMSARSTDGSDDGPLAGDPLVRSFRSQLRSMTTTPLDGFGDTAVYLTNFGISTERDGSLSFDTDTFEEQYAADPSAFAAIVRTQMKSDNDDITAYVTGDDYVAGVYDLTVSSGAGTVDGAAMTAIDTSFFSYSGNTDGLHVKTTEANATAKIYMGRSLINQLLTYTETILASSGDIDTKITNYNSDIEDYKTELADLATKEETIRERYVKQFAAMESVVRSLKDTGSYMESYMESWQSGLK